jgi:superfamily I DNA/RNA helicase
MGEIREWSPEQKRIFSECAHPDGNVIIEALAGTGKTTTIVEGGKYAPERSILYSAFNKRIEEELNLRLGEVRNAQSKTLHGLGFKFVRDAYPRIRLDKESKIKRADYITGEVVPYGCPDVVRKLVTKLHTKAREIEPHATEAEQLLDLAYRFDCVPDNGWAASGWDDKFVTEMGVQALEFAAKKIECPSGIDFSDMIFLPVRNKWIKKCYDLVFVDERQDMTAAQLELAVGASRGRVVLVGDRNQAIYGFRGADTNSFDRLKDELDAKVLELNTTYRCGKAIVELAQEFVPKFQAGPNNPPGEVLSIGIDKLVPMATGGDFILSRVNAPLVSVAMSLLRNQKRARIAGRDIGQGLKTIIRKMNATSIPNLLEKLVLWEEKQVIRLMAAKKEAQIDMVRDQAETIAVLAQDARSVQEMEQRIDALFTDDGLGQAGVITCSSVHRSKGLEAKRVFILRDTLRDFDQEEKNIQYVAITRAKETLVWVAGR